MKALIFISLCLITFCVSCNEIDFSDGTPKCMKDTIREWKKYACKDASVDEYLFQNSTVFLLNASKCCCDVASAVVDTECIQLGMLGGYEGNATINGEDFFANATYVRTIWDR